MQTLLHGPHGARAMYVGFESAENLASVAVAPSFRPDTTHQEIAGNVLSAPVRDWQRPVDTERTHNIADLFNGTGEFMPNPVLLCANPFAAQGALSVTRDKLPNGMDLNTFTVEVKKTTGDQRALWILDGQHRISGLSKSVQRSDSVPFVMLLDEGGDAYSPDVFAKIFAQVTTSARQLDPLHEAWLSYAFNLNAFSDSAKAPTPLRESFETSVLLCRVTQPNRLWNVPRFNPRLDPVNKHFEYDCIELAEMCRKNLFGRSGMHQSVTPKLASLEIARAVDALYTTMPVTNRKHNVIIGDHPRGQNYMQLGYLIGALSVLHQQGAPPSWQDLLKDLRFNEDEWDLTGETLDFSGTAGTTSKRIAGKLFRAAMTAGKLPPGATSLARYAMGEAAEQRLTVAGKTYSIKPNTKQTIKVGSSSRLRLGRTSDNIGKLIATKTVAKSQDVARKLKTGLDVVLQPGQQAVLEFEFHHFGDIRSDARIVLKRA